ncbi:MAG: TolB family protein [Sporichthyaceae bacterium]
MTRRTHPRRWVRAFAAGAVGVGAVLGASGAAAVPGAEHGTERVTLAVAEREADDASYTPVLSADGRWVAFASEATNLVRGDTNRRQDVFLRDTRTGKTKRVSVASGGRQSRGDSFNPSISGDGRYVVFDSWADDLVPGDTNRRGDVFLHDAKTGKTTRISTRVANHEEAHGNSGYGVISADGRHVAFESNAPDMRPGGGDQSDVYVWSRETGDIELISQGVYGAGHGNSGAPAISRDGRFVAFTSAASDLIVGDTNQRDDVFVRDRQTQTVRRASVNSVGGESNHESDAASISADGRYVAFESMAYSLTNVDPLPEATPKMFNPLQRSGTDANSASDVFVHDMLTGRTEMVSVSDAGVQGVRESYAPSISGDGRYVVYVSYADNLVPGDRNEQRDVFVRDLAAGKTTRMSVGDLGDEGAGLSYGPAISEDGTRTAFVSDAENLVPGDDNHTGDVFVRR